MKSHTKHSYLLYWKCDDQRFDKTYIVKTYSANPLHLIFRNVNWYFGEINKCEYLTLVPTNENKKKQTKKQKQKIKKK